MRLGKIDATDRNDTKCNNIRIEFPQSDKINEFLHAKF